MGGWVGATQSIGWSCFALILIRRQQLRVNQGIEINFVLFLSPEYIAFWALVRTCWNATCVHPLVGLGGGWGQNVMKHYATYNGNKKTIQKKSTRWRFRYGFQKWDADEKWNKLAQIFDSWVSEWRSPSAKVIPFCNSEGFSGHCRNPEEHQKTERWFLKEDQGVVGVNWVTLKKEGMVIPTNTLFLTFGSPELLKEITVGYLKMKVALFVPNHMHCFNCNKFGHTSQRCKVAAKCTGCGKDKHEGQCEGPKLCSNCNGPHASSAKDCPVWQKEKEIQRVRIEKRVSFPEARQLVEARMLTVVSGGKTYAVAASTRRESKSVQCQTSLTWVFSDHPLRTTESNVRSSGRPRSVLTSTQASSGKSRTVSAHTRVPCESVNCSSETDRGSADPPKTASRGSANPPKMASKGSAAPSKIAPKGSAGPLKTVTLKDDSSSSRCSPTKVRVDGVPVDVALHSFQQAPGTTQACNFRQTEEGRAESGSFQPVFCPVW